MNSQSLPFNVQVAAPAPAAVNKPGDAVPPLAQIVDPFVGDTWTLQGTTPFRNGKPTTPRLSNTNRVYINLQKVWCTAPNGYSYWNGTAWVWDGGHGADGNFF